MATGRPGEKALGVGSREGGGRVKLLEYKGQHGKIEKVEIDM